MNRKRREMIKRIVLGVFTLVVLAIIIIPQSPKKNPSVTTLTTPTIKQLARHSINLTSKGFEPERISIKKGEVVVWVNKSGKEATVNSANHPTHKLFPVLNLGSFSNGSSVQARIYRVGEFRYHNHLNPSQTGTIVVTE